MILNYSLEIQCKLIVYYYSSFFFSSIGRKLIMWERESVFRPILFNFYCNFQLKVFIIFHRIKVKQKTTDNITLELGLVRLLMNTPLHQENVHPASYTSFGKSLLSRNWQVSLNKKSFSLQNFSLFVVLHDNNFKLSLFERQRERGREREQNAI